MEFWGRRKRSEACPEGTPGLSPGFQPWETHPNKRRALKGRKRGLVTGAAFVEIMFYFGHFQSDALSGRFGFYCGYSQG
jgi:hypothetical protein